MKTGFKLVSNDIQALSSLIGLPPVMERVCRRMKKKTERGQRRREREKVRESETVRESQKREGERDRQTERGGGGWGESER